MSFEGKWRDYGPGGEPHGSSIQVGQTWGGEVFYDKPDRDGKRYWTAKLNTKPLGGFPNMAEAKSRVDWQIWNEMRLAQEGYKLVAARKETNVSFT